jgi:hypothetical protein
VKNFCKIALQKKNLEKNLENDDFWRCKEEKVAVAEKTSASRRISRAAESYCSSSRKPYGFQDVGKRRFPTLASKFRNSYNCVAMLAIHEKARLFRYTNSFLYEFVVLVPQIFSKAALVELKNETERYIVGEI